MTMSQVYPEHNAAMRKKHCRLNTTCIKQGGEGCSCVDIGIDPYNKFNCAFLALAQVDVLLRSVQHKRNYRIHTRADKFYIDSDEIRANFKEFLVNVLGWKAKAASAELYDIFGYNKRISVGLIPELAKFFEANIIIIFQNDKNNPDPLMTGFEYPCTFTLVHDNNRHVNAAIFIPIKQKIKDCDMARKLKNAKLFRPEDITAPKLAGGAENDSFYPEFFKQIVS